MQGFRVEFSLLLFITQYKHISRLSDFMSCLSGCQFDGSVAVAASWLAIFRLSVSLQSTETKPLKS